MTDDKRPPTGLLYGTVRLGDHNPAWAELFDMERKALLQCLGNAVDRVEHIGSTSVAGLIAKPILDLAIVSRDQADVRTIAGRMVSMGYIDRGDAGDDGGYLLVKESRPRVRSIHAHVVSRKNPQWRSWVGFRDLLRSNQAVRQEYAELKMSLAAMHSGDRKSYTAGKGDFIRDHSPRSTPSDM